MAAKQVEARLAELQRKAGAPGWSRLADRYYCRQLMGPVSWADELDPAGLETHLVAGAPLGGAVAIVRDERTKVGGVPRTRLHVLSASGHAIASLPWPRPRVIGLGWIEGERLAVLSDDGSVSVLSVKLEPLAEYALPDKVVGEGLAACEVLNSGVLIISGRHKLHYLRCLALEEPAAVARAAAERACGRGRGDERQTERALLKEAAVVHLADPRLEGTPRAMVGFEPPRAPGAAAAPGGGVRAYVATRSGTILVVDETAASDAMPSGGPFGALALAPNGRMIAACADSGELLVWPAHDLARPPLTKCRVGPPGAPPHAPLSAGALRQLLWCGSDAVLLSWARGGGLSLVGPAGDVARFAAEPAAADAHCVSEPDGARLLGRATTHLLSRVGEAMVGALRGGGSGGARSLIEASEALQLGDSARADALARALGAGLGAAVEACAEAGTHALDDDVQVACLRAAALGRAVLNAAAAAAAAAAASASAGGNARAAPPLSLAETADAHTNERAVRDLRTLRALRAPSVGVQLTYAQLRAHCGLPLVLGRLLARGEHMLAARLCALHGLPQARVFEHWACARIATAVAAEGADEGGVASHGAADVALLELLLPRLQADGAVSYAAVAGAANALGRRALAARLLQLETRATEQVPLLLEMGLHAPALARACASHDSDLVHLVLLSARRAVGGAAFASLVVAQPIALALHAAYLRAQDPPGLKSLYAEAGLPLEAARVALRQAYSCARMDERLRALGVSHDLLALDRASSGANAAREAAEALALLRAQCDLELATAGIEPPVSALERSPFARGRSESEAQGARRRHEGFVRSAGAAPPPPFRFIDTSLSETLYNCFLYAQAKRAAKLRSEFRVPDKRFWRLQIRALAHCRDWDALEELAREKKSPVGYGPFIDACLEMGAMAEGAQFVVRLASAREKATYLVKLGRVQEAREVALLSKDAAELLESIARNEH